MKTKTIILVVILALGLFFIFPAIAESNPVVPGLSEIWQKEKIVNSQSTNEPNGNKAVNLTCIQQPSLDGVGKWSIALDSSHGSVNNITCRIMMKDYSNEYTTTYNKKYTYAINSFTSCQIVSGGEYCFAIWVYFSDGYTGYDKYVFTIADDNNHTSLTEKVTQVVNSCRASTNWQTALNLYDWLTTHVYYDHELEYYGADMILRGYGVCDGYSKAYMMLCKKAGIPVGRVTNYNHAWNAIQIGGDWYYVDATWDDPGNEKNLKSGNEGHWYFCITQKILYFDHPTTNLTQDNNIGECISLAMNYFVQKGEWRNWGTSFNSTSVTNKFPTIIQDTFNSGETVFELQDDTKIYYQVKNGAGYYYNMGSDRGRTVKEILLYSLRNTSMSIENGGPIKVQVVDSPLTVKLLGWDINETGTLKIPSKVKIIPTNGFVKTRATTVIIPENCTSINSKAFNGSSVRTVKIPDSLTYIASDAFINCERIIFKTRNSVAIQYASTHGMIVLDP